MNNWAISKVYLYIVALITFSVLFVNFVMLTQAISSYLLPSAMHWTLDHVGLRNELFIRKYGYWPDLQDPEQTQRLAAFTLEEIEDFRIQRQAEIIRENRDADSRNIIQHTFLFMLLLPLHIYFFKLARKS